MPAESEPPRDALEAALADVIDALSASGAVYALIGGLATGFRSRPRYTQDIDLLIDIPQVRLPDLLERLRARRFEVDVSAVIAELRRHHLAVLWRGDIRLDWLTPAIPAYRHVLEAATTESGPSGPIRVAAAEGLILMKLLAHRLQDQADIEALVAANRGVLDVDWIRREWEAIFPIDDPRWRWLERQVAGGI
jgi:hypothetical protein